MFACNYTGLANLNQVIQEFSFLPTEAKQLKCYLAKSWNWDAQNIVSSIIWPRLLPSAFASAVAISAAMFSKQQHIWRIPKKRDTLTELVFPVRSNGAEGHRKFFHAPDKKSSELWKYYLLYMRVVPATEKQPQHYKWKKKGALQFSIIMLEFQLTFLSLQWLWLVGHTFRHQDSTASFLLEAYYFTQLTI